MRDVEIEQIEIDLLLEAIFRRYGYDFRDYARASLKRRVMRQLTRSGAKHVSDLIPAMVHDEAAFGQFLGEMSITVTEMFRDPSFFRAVRQHVIPVLKTYPFIKIWHAGCATGEEVYSMAIVLKEEGLLDRAQIYATDFNTASLKKAQEGIYPANLLRDYTRSYKHAGGEASLSEYYHVAYGGARISDWLKKKITFANHNLSTDRVFGEMNLIVCRNVLIYFAKPLQELVLSLFSKSLCHRGFIALGTKESLSCSSLRNRFVTLVDGQRIFRRID